MQLEIAAPSIPPTAPTLPMTAVPETRPHTAERRLLLQGVRWLTYEMLLQDLSEQAVRMTYDRGRLEIMAPSFRHEGCSVVLGQFIRVMAQEFKLPFKSGRTTTFRNPEMQRGLEADDCFYIESLPRILGKLDIDLAVDPPPDLALEVEISPGALDRMEVYAALRVPQVWRLNRDGLRIYCLGQDGKYAAAAESPTFPGVAPAMLITYLQQGLTIDETSLVESFRAWVRQEVIARRPQPGST